jgi:hypothetical protein
MKVGDEVYICCEYQKFKSIIEGETDKYWNVKTGWGTTKYSKSSLKKVEVPYFGGFYIKPVEGE